MREAGTCPVRRLRDCLQKRHHGGAARGLTAGSAAWTGLRPIRQGVEAITAVAPFARGNKTASIRVRQRRTRSDQGATSPQTRGSLPQPKGKATSLHRRSHRDRHRRNCLPAGIASASRQRRLSPTAAPSQPTGSAIPAIWRPRFNLTAAPPRSTGSAVSDHRQHPLTPLLARSHPTGSGASPLGWSMTIWLCTRETAGCASSTSWISRFSPGRSSQKTLSR